MHDITKEALEHAVAKVTTEVDPDPWNPLPYFRSPEFEQAVLDAIMWRVMCGPVSETKEDETNG